MWIGGAHGKNLRKTGILEELLRENAWRNPQGNWHLWDSVLYETARFQPGLVLLLNCTCTTASRDGDRIAAVRAWQMTNETWHTIRAVQFLDASGDGLLAERTGADYRIGRESQAEHGESIEPEIADRKTMGLSCLIQMRETDREQPFTPPAWAYRYERCTDLPHRGHRIGTTNFWWIELGGEQDSIHDAETIRDELLKVAFGVWDHIKNHCQDQDARTWVLEWIGFLPGKRESRRILGDHILTQNEVQAEGRFDDLVAYGGWSMDDHHPAGFHHPGQPTIHHKAPSPFGIPYRCLYSRNIANLSMAGRNISATHAAMSSSRVMATCAVIGQAAGTGAALAIRLGITPREVHGRHMAELQQRLMDDDCYLPWRTRTVSSLTTAAILESSTGEAGRLRDDVDRDAFGEPHAWEAPPGTAITMRWDRPVALKALRLVFDSDLSRPHTSGFMPCCYRLAAAPLLQVPPSLVRDYRLEARIAGTWQVLLDVTGNHQRLRRHAVTITTEALRLIPLATWGHPLARIFAWDAVG